MALETVHFCFNLFNCSLLISLCICNMLRNINVLGKLHTVLQVKEALIISIGTQILQIILIIQGK
jgi:hypothetical protein